MTAFVIWFAHFMLCWAVAEFGPGAPWAQRAGWLLTVVALAAMAVHAVRVLRRGADHAKGDPGEVPTFNRHFARGAIAIATVAVLFTAVPAVVITG